MPTNDKHVGDCFWGKLASDILTQNWDQSLLDLNQLKEFIDKNEVFLLKTTKWNKIQLKNIKIS